MAEMTKRERAMRTIRFEETDRVPLYDILQSDPVIEHYAGRPLTYEDGWKTTARAVGRTLDMTRMITGPQRLRTDLGEDGRRVQVERWTSWTVKRPFRDFTDLVPWVEDRIRALNATTFGPEDAAPFHNHIDQILAIFAEADPTGRDDPTVLVIESGVGLDGMYSGTGMTLFTDLLMERPDLVEEWLDARNEAELRRVAVIADPRRFPVALTYDDIAHKTGTIFSPTWLHELWAPRLKRLVDAWHTRDTLCLYHSDGNLWPILDDLVAAGIDGLNPLEVLAGMTPKTVRDAYPNLFLTGGIDVSQLLPLGTPDEVRTACRQAIHDTNGRGYFLGSSTELHWDVPLANARAMFETAWESGERG
ncbi:MAG: hypothetical protein GY851_31825 [bacterium]|nr:hypothetical protein [bacterium]